MSEESLMYIALPSDLHAKVEQYQQKHGLTRFDDAIILLLLRGLKHAQHSNASTDADEVKGGSDVATPWSEEIREMHSMVTALYEARREIKATIEAEVTPNVATP